MNPYAWRECPASEAPELGREIWIQNTLPAELISRRMYNDSMKPKFVAIGAFLLVLGAALIAVTPVLTTSALFKAELQGAPSTTASNSTAILSAEVNAITQTEYFGVAGVVIASIGGGILGYGVHATYADHPRQDLEAREKHNPTAEAQ